MSDATTTLGQVMERSVSGVFGERDPGRRRRAIAELYAEDCAFYDAGGESIGQAAVGADGSRWTTTNAVAGRMTHRALAGDGEQGRGRRSRS